MSRLEMLPHQVFFSVYTGAPQVLIDFLANVFGASCYWLIYLALSRTR